MIKHMLILVTLFPYVARNGSKSLGEESGVVLLWFAGKQLFVLVALGDPIDYICPQAVFKKKHWCQPCTNAEESLAFSKRVRVGVHFSNVNTVIMGQVHFHALEGRLCKSSAAPVMRCDLVKSFCELLGTRCFTNHTMLTGHLLHRHIRCEDG